MEFLDLSGQRREILRTGFQNQDALPLFVNTSFPAIDGGHSIEQIRAGDQPLIEQDVDESQSVLPIAARHVNERNFHGRLSASNFLTPGRGDDTLWQRIVHRVGESGRDFLP